MLDQRPIVGERVYTNYRMTLPGEEVLGTLVVRDGLIADIQPGVSAVGEDGEGSYLLPGFIDVHTDHFEKCTAPRPGVFWPLEAAAIYHDRNLAIAGVTTVCDAIPINRPERRGLLPGFASGFVQAIEEMNSSGTSTVEHWLHLRCELGYREVVDVAETLIGRPRVALMSLMDHTPGNRQFRNIEDLKSRRQPVSSTSETFEEFVARAQSEQAEFGERNRERLVALSRENGIVLATHDDTEVDHVRAAAREGATIIEFPTTVEAAREARVHGLAIVMGSPNFILGGSHSGNVSARELAQLGLVDIVASDYVPQSMLQSVFVAAQAGGLALFDAVKMISESPARAIRLFEDRGSLEVGKRADIVTAVCHGRVPRITGVMAKGRRIA
jgi:alpha-D-ribose 1-methylphosphonate 5-triphosphate diphosphatase